MLNTVDISNIFPPYFSLGFLNLAITIIFVILILWIARKILSIKFQLRIEYVFLEVKPTDRAIKSPLSTIQLFSLFHSLGKPSSFTEKFLGIKKSISYELISNKEEGIRFILRVPRVDASSIKKTLIAYLPGVEIIDTHDYLEKASSFSELSLRKPFVFPLQRHEILKEHDPIAYLTAHLTKLKENERVALQFICTPIDESTHSGETNLISSIKRAMLNNEDISNHINMGTANKTISFFASVLLFIILSPITVLSWILSSTENAFPTWIFQGKKNNHNNMGSNKTDLYSNILDKINEPLFETKIRIYIEGADQQERIKGILSTFETFSSPYQSFKLQKPIFNFIIQLNIFLLKNRFSIFSSKTILSTSELSSLYHLPYTETTKTEDLLLVKSPKIPAPLSLKKSDIKLDITFAKNIYGESTTPIGLTLEERRRHVYIIGSTGTGKTTLLSEMIYQDICKGNGVAIIDPHGDLAGKLLGIIPENRIKDVVYFNPYDIEFPIGLNVLEIPKGLPKVELQREKDFITSTLISIFHKLYDPRYSGPRMEHILRNVILTALEQENPTLFTIYNLLTNKKYRKQVVDLLNDEILKSFWKNEFDKQGSNQRAEQIAPITNKLGRFLTTGMTRNILNQTESKLDFEMIMNNKKILICNLSKGKIGEDTAYFLGGLLTAKIQLTALRRVHIPEDKRPDFFLYIDEFQNFATMSFAQILSEARKYRLSVILAHQNTVQIEDDLLETIIGNTGTLICFRTTSPKDETKLLPVFAPEVEKGQMANLPSYNFYMKINALQPQTTFSGEINNFNIETKSKTKNEVICSSRENFSQRQIEIFKEIKSKPLKSTNVFELVK